MRNQFQLDIHHELFVDNFAGGGGASTGIELALGRSVDHAVNHAFDALGMHRINHPQTIHHCEDVFDVNPAALTEGRRVGGAWFSPDCKHFSKAKGGKPLSKKIRGLAFVMLRWAKIRVRVIYMENVEEIQTWGPLLSDGKPDPSHRGRTWSAFKAALGNGVSPDSPDLDEMLEVLGDSVTREELIRGFGYTVETKEMRACDYGAPTIRKRLFLIARCDGKAIVWPKPTHAVPENARKLGLKPYRPVSDCIDWTIPCHSIFLASAEAKSRGLKVKRPLAKATLRRIAAGVDRYVLKAQKPFLVSLTHQGGDRVEPIDQPIATITGAHRGEKALCAPSLMRHFGESIGQGVDSPAPTVVAGGGGKTAVIQSSLAPFITEHANASNQRNVAVDKPMPTQCAEVKGGHFALVGASIISKHSKDAPQPVTKPNGTAACRDSFAIAAANIVKFRGTPETHPPAKDATKPVDTISAAGLHHGVSAAFLAQHNGGFNTNPGHTAGEPASTISAKGSQQQVVTANIATYYGNDTDGQGVGDPLRTVTVKERFGLSQNEMAIAPMTTAQVAGARRVAEFLREHGVQFEGEFAGITVDGSFYAIWDIGMRMLMPRELFRAQGFPDDYVIDRAWLVDPKTGTLKEIRLTKEQQIRMCGNSVSPHCAEALVSANSGDMAVWNTKEKRQFKAASYSFA